MWTKKGYYWFWHTAICNHKGSSGPANKVDAEHVEHVNCVGFKRFQPDFPNAPNKYLEFQSIKTMNSRRFTLFPSSQTTQSPAIHF